MLKMSGRLGKMLSLQRLGPRSKSVWIPALKPDSKEKYNQTGPKVKEGRVLCNTL